MAALFGINPGGLMIFINNFLIFLIFWSHGLLQALQTKQQVPSSAQSAIIVASQQSLTISTFSPFMVIVIS
jgi:hypothetical protein